MQNAKAKEYLEQLELIEGRQESDTRFLREVESETDRALQSGDAYAFLLVSKMFETQEGRRILRETGDLLRLYYLMDAVQKETASGVTPFTTDAGSFRELMEKYTETGLMLRRIEYRVTPGEEEAFTFLRGREISPFAVYAVLYNPTSYHGHREQVLLLLAEDALKQQQYKTAHGFLSVIESPSPETVALRERLGGIAGGVTA